MARRIIDPMNDMILNEFLMDKWAQKVMGLAISESLFLNLILGLALTCSPI